MQEMCIDANLLSFSIIKSCWICDFLAPGKNIVHQISVTLEDLYNGATRKLAVQKNTICERCEGMSSYFLYVGCGHISELLH